MAVNKLNFSVVKSKIEKIATTHSIDTNQAFLRYVINLVVPSITDRFDEIITEGSSDQGVDALIIEPGDTRYKIHIIQTKYTNLQKNCSSHIKENAIHKLHTFLKRLRDKDVGLTSTGNRVFDQQVQAVFELFEAGNICEFNFYVCSNQKGLSPQALQKATTVLSDDQSYFHELTFEDIYNHIFYEAEKRESCELKIIDKQIYERTDGDIKGIVANIDVTSFVDAISNKSGAIKRYLFDENIRSYLGKNSGYNKDILSSALRVDNHLFWYLNNGITIVCDKATYQKQISGASLKLENFRIVNGAQTSFSIWRAYEDEPEIASQIVLLVKIYETDNKEIAQQVTIATNSQASIYARDLRANDKIQHLIEKVLKEEGITYLRRRGDDLNLETPKLETSIDAMKLGQMIMAYKLNKPHKCKTESDHIFGDFYSEIFNADLDGSYISNLNFCYQEIMKTRAEFQKQGHNFIGNRLPSKYYVLNYGYWFILSAVALICRKEKNTFPPNDRVSEYIDKAVTYVSDVVETVSDKSQYNIFRSRKVNEKFLEKFRDGQLDMFE